MQLFRKILNILWEFPCPLCDCDNPARHDFNTFCPDCLKELPLLSGKRCPGCGGELDGALEQCRQCLSMPPRPWSKAVSVMQMEGVGEKVIYQLKFSGNTAMARAIAELAYPLLNNPEYRQCDMIVPVPLYWKRFLQRGYNQSEVLAKMLARYLDIPVKTPVKRIRHTTRQATLTREERLKNLKGAFAVPKPEKVKDKTILLIDDVLTTGSTLHACAEALCKAGVKDIKVFTVARR